MSIASQLLEAEMSAGQKVMLVGDPGLAKTHMILQTAEKTGYQTTIETDEGVMSTVMRASLLERVDLTGCMVPDNKLGVTRQLPFVLIKALQSVKQKIVLFVDDFGQPPIDVQGSLMRLFDNHFLPPNVLIWAATNRPGTKSGVNSLCEPLRSRFDSVYLIPTPDNPNDEKGDGGTLLCSWREWADNWLEWAMDNGAPPEVIAWHRSSRFSSLYNWKPNADPSLRMADFRSWGAVIDRWNKGLRSLRQIASVIGKGAAAEFLAFAKLAEKLPTPDEVWKNPKTAKVPEETSAQYLISSVLSQQVVLSVASEFITYVSRLPRLFTALAVRDAYNRKDLGSKLAANTQWVKWFDANQKLFLDEE